MRTDREIIVESDPRSALLHLALPMMAGNIAQNLFTLIDMYFVGRLGSLQVAAVGMAGVVTSAMMTLIIGLSAATRAIVARYIGANDYEMAHKAAFGAIIYGLIVSAVIALFGLSLGKYVLMLLGAKANLLVLSTRYLVVALVGAFSMVMLFVTRAIFQGAGDAKTPMFIVFGAVILNIILDPLLIFGLGPFPRLGVVGAALATVIARFVGFIIALLLLAKGVRTFRLDFKKFGTTKDILVRYLSIGVPGGAQPMINNLTAFVMMRIITSFGVFATAAYSIGVRLNMIASLPGFAIGNAAGTLVGQNLGAGKPDRAKKGVLIGVKLYELFAIPTAFIYIVLAPQIASLFSKDTETIRLAIAYLSIVPLSYPVFAVGAIVMRGINGSGHTTPPFLAQLLALFLIQIPVAYFSSKFFGAAGVFLGVFAGMFAKGVLILPYFSSNKWLTVGKWE